MGYYEYKLGENNTRIAKAECNDRGEITETFHHFVIRLEWELRIASKKDWKKVFYKKDTETEWKSFYVEGENKSIKDYGFIFP
jgi:hypothetical protein